MLHNNRTIKAAGILITFFLTGMMNTILAPVIPAINTNLGVSLTKLGLAVTIISAARLTAVIPAGILADRWSRVGIIRIGTAVIFIGALIIGIMPFGFVFYLCMVLFGIGHAFMDGSANAMITDLYPEKSGGVLNLLHMFFGIGGFVGPFVYGFSIEKSGGWKLPFIILSVTGGFVLFFLSFLKFPKRKNENVKGRKPNMPFKISGIFIFLCIMMFMMIGTNKGFKTWINTFLEYKFAVTAMVASAVLAFSNGGVMLGRFICSLVAEKIGYGKILVIGMAGTVLFGLIVILSPNATVSMIAFVFAGAFMSPFFPISIALASKLFPDKKGTISGLFTVFASLGSMIFPALCGYIADVTGNIQNGMLLLPFIPVIPLSVFILWGKSRIKSKLEQI